MLAQLSILELILLVAMQRLKAQGKEESLNFESVRPSFSSDHLPAKSSVAPACF